ncbi:MAG: Na+/H+ antiporter NhaC family protein [Pyramidobacter sp.]|uniref:Na+/H+ antiporter NhaC family protein n=1 Tax=Pyramidobacter sp. TaxID=1943581 RepID=UPI002A7F8E41|nr:Na+/H+ antiporter NhaC family protein [Pyramidobacter sp.]MDY4031900.1 Na+/H+ antiporter NhaC family protein [Pyramidobacter sp.]
MDQIKKENVQFYGGTIGPWLPMITMIVLMILSTATHTGGLNRVVLIAFACLALGFFLCKDRKNYGKITLQGLVNPMLGTILMAYILAGVLAQLMRQSGIIDALIWAVSKIGMNTGFLPLIAFIVCMLISTSCGTSTGSVAAVAPVLVPLAASVNIDVGLMCGAIISGAIFGDNLAPISDTTISSALTQEAELSDVVRTRFPYAAISAVVAAILFVIFGLKMSSGIGSAPELNGSTARSLILLILPVLMVIMMNKGWDLIATLITCDVLGIVLNLVLGCISMERMLDASGPVVAGMVGMMILVLYVMLLFQMLEILNASGAFGRLNATLLNLCKTPRSGELVCYLAACLGSFATGGSGIAILFFGSVVRSITKTFGIDRCRGANILDGVACGTTGLMPYGNPMLVSLGVALAVDGISPDFSFLNIVPYTFHCWGLLLIFLISILTGIGRKFEMKEVTLKS